MRLKFNMLFCLIVLVGIISFVSAEERFHIVLSNEQNFVFMENDGTGKFTAKQIIDASPLAHEITAGDFDLDGIWDAAVNHHQEGAFTVLWGNKDKTFVKQKFIIPVAPQGEMHAIGSGDFDEDGDVDLALVDNGFPTRQVVIAFSDGKRGFSDFKKYEMLNNGNARVIKVNDFNGDKHLDFIVPYSGEDNVFIFFGDGTGKFDMKTFQGGSRLHALETGDIDNDGDVDIGFADFQYIRILKNDGKGEFSTSDKFCIKNTQGDCTQPDLYSVELADLDEDGFMDAIGLRADGIYIWRGDGTGKFKASTRRPASVEFTQIFRNAIDIESADVDNDNIKDIIIGSLDAGFGVQSGDTGILVFKNKIDTTGCKEPDPNNPDRMIILGPGPICVESVTKYNAGRTNQPDQVMIDIYPEKIEEQKTFTRGDADGSKEVDMSDAIYLLTSLFLGGEQPKCLDAADIDDTGVLDVTDAVYLLNYLFLGSNLPPPAPFNNVGEDPTQDGLDCEFYPNN